MAKFKMEIIVPDGTGCKEAEGERICDFVREDVCNEYLDCCLFGQYLDRDLSKKCPKCLNVSKQGGK